MSGENIRGIIETFRIKSVFGYQHQNEAVKELNQLLEYENMYEEKCKELEEVKEEYNELLDKLLEEED